jgi:glycerol kinase
MPQARTALDQGTTSSRALVFDLQGRVVAMAQRELPQHYPQPGQVEHDATRIWRDTLACAHEALQRAALTAADIAAIGITNQRETVVLWDRATGRPLAPAIVWQDRRTADVCARLRPTATKARCARKPAWCSTPTSRPARSPGCSITCPMRAPAPGAANWPAARSTAGWCGSSPADAATSPT